jgi:hypothetical protein
VSYDFCTHCLADLFGLLPPWLLFVIAFVLLVVTLMLVAK